MKIVATMPVRNEGWILGLTARAALMWCDVLLVLEHYSTDAREIRYKIMDERKDAQCIMYQHVRGPWCEMDHRQNMMDEARRLGASHIAILDADEILTGNLVPRIRDICDSMAVGQMLELPQINVRGDIGTMHTQGLWAGQHTAVVFRDEPGLHWSADAKGYQHHHRAPHGRTFAPLRPIGRRHGGLFHMQMLDERRLRAKQYLYQLNDVLGGFRTPEAARQYYSLSVYGCVPATVPSAADSWEMRRTMPGLGPVPPEWWEAYRDLLPHLKPDVEPWQLDECRRILKENPGIGVGLDAFGLDL